ncbi:MAG: hypothetical protein WBW73_06780 [Rhodoplanes sp.]
MTAMLGGLAMGIVCAVALYYIVTDFLGLAPTHEALEKTAAHIPMYATARAPTATADYVGSIGRARSARAGAKVTLPIIGTSTTAESRTPTAAAAARLKDELP